MDYTGTPATPTQSNALPRLIAVRNPSFGHELRTDDGAWVATVSSDREDGWALAQALAAMTEPEAPPTDDANGGNDSFVWSDAPAERLTNVPLRWEEADALSWLRAVWATEQVRNLACGFRRDTFAFWLQEIAVVRGGRTVIDRGALQDAGGRE